LQPFSAFAAAPMLDWLLKEKQITQHVSVLDRSNREGGTCERADCPGQQAMSAFGGEADIGWRRRNVR
jgi:hypothetical protein